MGSGYFGEPNMGNERGIGGSSTSSRKGKKSNSEKPKQPQRGLGVAQLEKIRLHGQLGFSNYNPNSFQSPYPSNFHNEDMKAQTAYSSIPSSSSFSYSTISSSTSSASHAFHPNYMMGVGDYERTNIIYGDSQPTTAARWDLSNNMLDSQHFMQPGMTRHLLNPLMEESQQIYRNKHGSDHSIGSSSQNSESSETQELDLELRLSI